MAVARQALTLWSKRGLFYHLNFGGSSVGKRSPKGRRASLEIFFGYMLKYAAVYINQHIITKFLSQMFILLTKNFTRGA